MGILDKAKKLIHGDRAKTYGSAEKSFQNIANFWNIYLNKKYGTALKMSSEDVANLMILMKISRNTGKYHEDNYVDIAGYAELGDRLASPVKEEEKKTSDVSAKTDMEWLEELKRRKRDLLMNKPLNIEGIRSLDCMIADLTLKIERNNEA